MSAKWFKLCVVCLLVLTVALPVWHRFGMRTSFTVDGVGHYPVRTYDDRARGGASVASLERIGHVAVMHCKLAVGYKAPYCAIHISLGDGAKGIDLSRFDTVTLDIASYRADTRRASQVTVYLRDYNPAYANLSRPDTFKANTYQYTPLDGDQPLSVPLANFHVASWWVQNYHVPLAYARPSLRNIVALDVTTGDWLVPGNYAIAVHSIRFSGKWLTRDALLALLVGLWFVAAMAYLVGSAWQARRAASAATAGRRELERINARLASQRDELRSAANHDELTGAYNRMGLHARLAPGMARSGASPRVLTVVFMDVDRFKAVNDHFGHAVGDACLKHLATLITRHIRANDLFARWGGEEFLLACVGQRLAPTAEFAERLRALIAGFAWPTGVALSCSFGVAELEPDEVFEDLLRRADAALYAAKRDGRNCVRVATPTPDAD